MTNSQMSDDEARAINSRAFVLSGTSDRDLEHIRGRNEEFRRAPLGAAMRSALKSAITSNVLWDLYRKNVLHGADSGSLSKAGLINAAQAFAIRIKDLDCDAPMRETAEAEAETAAPVERDPVAASVERVLAPLALGRAWINPQALSDLEANVANVIRDAMQASARQTVVRVDGDGQPIDGPMAKMKGTSTLGGVFGAGGAMDTFPVVVWDYPFDGPHAVPHDSGFVYDDDILADLAVCIETERNAWLAGPAGTGKTTLPAQYASRTGRPFVRVPFERTTEAVELIGGRYPKAEGGTEWIDGALTAAIRKPGCVILLDEPTFARPGALATLQTLLDHRFLTLKENGGERVECAPGVVFVIADNTSGSGDGTGAYHDTQAMNRAFMDRQSKVIRVGYLPPAKEAQALASRTGAPLAGCAMLVDYAGRTREAAAQGEMVGGLSLRRLSAVAMDITAGIDPARAMASCVYNVLPEDDAEVARQLANAHLDLATLGAALTGKAAPAPSQRKHGFDAVEA